MAITGSLNKQTFATRLLKGNLPDPILNLWRDVIAMFDMTSFFANAWKNAKIPAQLTLV